MKIQALDFSVDLLRNLLWQYNEAARLQRLIELKQDWHVANQTAYWTDWVTDVFDLRTANDFGLSVWAIILNVPLVVTPEPDPGKIAFGFGPERANFNQGNFAPTSSSFGLTTEQKRLVLRMRYFQLVTRGTVPEVNTFMASMFGPGEVYVSDGLSMNIRYVFTNEVPATLRLVFEAYDLLPRPAGVKVDFRSDNPGTFFGFGQYRKNFENGNFHA